MGGESDVEVADGEIPEETAGPVPGRRLQRPQRADRVGQSSAATSPPASASASGVAEGVPLTVRLKVYDLAGEDVTALAGAAIYLWHCDREGSYSMYDGDVADENYLRGVQEADADGWLEFTTIFPAAYSGRWPHIHFEVYPSPSTRPPARRTSCAPPSSRFPEDACDEVYATEGYEQTRRPTWPRSASTPTGSSPTATRCSWPPSPARSTTATSPP